VDQNYKPFWPKLSLESWDQMRLRCSANRYRPVPLSPISYDMAKDMITQT